MLSYRFISAFFIGAVLLAWVLPSSWLKNGHLPIISTEPKSPWSTVVKLEEVAWGNGSPYVRISTGELTSSLLLSGWSLENERGDRAEVGLGVEEISLGKAPVPVPIMVASNTSIVASFGPSPLGVSFKENVCSSYLRGTKDILPPMESRCPQLSSFSEWGTLDESCRSLVSTIPRCEVVSPEHLRDMSPACDAFLRSVPTYPACMNLVGPKGALPLWRIFLGQRPEFIHKDGGVLSLRDDHGLIVSTYVYQTIGVE